MAGLLWERILGSTVLAHVRGHPHSWEERKIGTDVEHFDKDIDLEYPTLPFNQLYLGGSETEPAVDREAASTELNGRENKKQNTSQSIAAWSNDVEGHSESASDVFVHWHVSALKLVDLAPVCAHNCFEMHVFGEN